MKTSWKIYHNTISTTKNHIIFGVYNYDLDYCGPALRDLISSIRLLQIAEVDNSPKLFCRKDNMPGCQLPSLVQNTGRLGGCKPKHEFSAIWHWLGCAWRCDICLLSEVAKGDEKPAEICYQIHVWVYVKVVYDIYHNVNNYSKNQIGDVLQFVIMLIG